MSHEKWLRQAANEIREAGHNGWGNTCEFAADEIERLRGELAKARELLAEALDAVRGKREFDGMREEIKSFLDAKENEQ